MVTVVFRRAGQELLRLEVSYGQPVTITGDASWFDFSLRPISTRTGQAVGLADDGEEWARTLVDAYRGTNMEVRLLPVPLAAPTP